MIDELVRLIPNSLANESGSVFYSGRQAFRWPSDLYILGLNPGGRVEDHADETVSWHTNRILKREPDNWSAYRDESWEGTVPGTAPMQRRMLHLFARIGRDPGLVPASNVIFLRSSREAELQGDTQELAARCWPLHEKAIDMLSVRVIVCLNQTAASWVCEQFRARTQVDEFTERNRRRWRSKTFRAKTGRTVVALTYPGIADWTNPATDPTHLVKQALEI